MPSDAPLAAPADHHHDPHNDRPDETPAERADRHFVELLQELRVAQTGVQILFAFLLTLPFTARWVTITEPERVVYLCTLIAAASASAFLIAPVAVHRLTFQQGVKHAVVRTSDKLALIGLCCLVLSVIGAVFLIVDVVAGGLLAGILAAFIAGLFSTLWFVLPMRLVPGRR
ncbi:DUF6328 family protein [Luedemannella helvata]|uniref:DUF6328 family protein n=1 Tax=Luedemannella helvata TaxID=349315 RepID=A0ABP4VZI0_9ACTN